MFECECDECKERAVVITTDSRFICLRHAVHEAVQAEQTRLANLPPPTVWQVTHC